ncbi:MAG: glutamine amidotransferase-related protein, partial [Notoacmeibacter sp.]
VPMQPEDKTLRIPQIGWNTLDGHIDHALLKDIPLGENGWHAYFVHSYHMAVTKPAELVATTQYGMAVTAMVGRDNMAGTQFHPEKSQKLGLKLISNFLGWRV